MLARFCVDGGGGGDGGEEEAGEGEVVVPGGPV